MKIYGVIKKKAKNAKMFLIDNAYKGTDLLRARRKKAIRISMKKKERARLKQELNEELQKYLENPLDETTDA